LDCFLSLLLALGAAFSTFSEFLLFDFSIFLFSSVFFGAAAGISLFSAFAFCFNFFFFFFSSNSSFSFSVLEF
jgi:hypothetical protein